MLSSYTLKELFRAKISPFLFVGALAFSSYILATKIILHFDEPKLLARVNQVYGSKAEHLTQKWFSLLKSSSNDSTWNKLHKVNHFFNENITYQNDLQLWNEKDYWATPIETLGRAKGDCEDYAIAKFFSLVALGVPEENLRLMYVRQLEVNQPHMVLIYFQTPTALPLVLDNFDLKIKPANKRPDLRPIYSFNGNGLWLAKSKGTGKKVKNSKGVSAWGNLIARIEQGDLRKY